MAFQGFPRSIAIAQRNKSIVAVVASRITGRAQAPLEYYHGRISIEWWMYVLQIQLYIYASHHIG